MRREDRGNDTDVSQGPPLPRLKLTEFMRDASKWPAIDVTPDSLPAALRKLPGGKPSCLRLPSGMYACCSIANTAQCLIRGTHHVKDASDSVTDGDDKVCSGGREAERSSVAIFQQPIKINSSAPLVIHGVWFMNRVEVVGRGPVFFSQCLFGASTWSSDVAVSSSSSQFASVHLAVDGVCTFSGCDFDYFCGRKVVGGEEVPAVTASGRTKLNISNSRFSGLGVVSTALALLDSARLEADYLSVVRCGSHSLVVGGRSKATVLRSIFDFNGNGVWVKDKGDLEIRDSSLEHVQHGHCCLLTNHGRCSVHGSALSAWATKTELVGRSILEARNHSHLSLNSCDLLWRKENHEQKESIKSSNLSVVRSDVNEERKDFGLCHVLLRGRSEATISRCVLRLPSAEGTHGKNSVVGVLLRGLPRRDSIPLYAVENTVVYGWPMEGDTALRATAPTRPVARHTWGLVLPPVSGGGNENMLRQMTTMWITANWFLDSNKQTLKDVSLAYSSYESYCQTMGILPDAANKEAKEEEYNNDKLPLISPFSSSSSSSSSSYLTANNGVKHCRKKKTKKSLAAATTTTTTTSTIKGRERSPSIPASTITTSVSSFGISPPLIEHTLPRNFCSRTFKKEVADGDSSSTSLTTYSDDEEGTCGRNLSPKRVPEELPKIRDSSVEHPEKREVIISDDKNNQSTSEHVNMTDIPFLLGERGDAVEEITTLQPTLKDEYALESGSQTIASIIDTPRTTSLTFPKTEKKAKNTTTTTKKNIQESKRFSCSFPSGRRWSAQKNRQVDETSREATTTTTTTNTTGGRCQSKLANLLSERKRNTFIDRSNSPRRKSRTPGSRASRIMSNENSTSGLFVYRRESSRACRKSSLSGKDLPCERLFDTTHNNPSTEVWPWEVSALRKLLGEKLGLFPGRGENEREFRLDGGGYQGREEEGEDFNNGEERKGRVRRNRKKRASPSRAGLDTPPLDIGEKGGGRGGGTLSRRRSLRLRPMSSMHFSDGRSSRAATSTRGENGKWTTLRLYEDFWNKWNKRQLFRDLLEQLRREQRERERLSREEMEDQAHHMHTAGRKGVRRDRGGREAEVARNYTLQQRDDTQICKNNVTNTEVDNNFPSLVFPRSFRNDDVMENQEIVRNKGHPSVDGDAPKIPPLLLPVAPRAAQGRNKSARERRTATNYPATS